MQANDLRPGVAVLLKGQIYLVTDFKHHTPGNKRAFIQATLRELKGGKIIQQRFSSTESVDEAHLDSKKVQYLYHDQDGYHFMDMEDYHSFALQENMIGDKKYYLRENDEIVMDFHEGNPVMVEVPNHVFLKIVDSPPGVKGDSVSNTLKPATTETGLKVQVPMFVQEGTVIKVDTRTGEYLGRQ
ncbi:MAG: elongation factor P [Candidatus Omnitrophica bacterium]|nr:elongation factor P [Candidatus Omnitrophota bacterium]